MILIVLPEEFLPYRVEREQRGATRNIDPIRIPQRVIVALDRILPRRRMRMEMVSPHNKGETRIENQRRMVGIMPMLL